jgi:glutaconate CoA-transferase subunit A
VSQADVRGNTQILGPDPYFDDLFCQAAKRRYVSCERIVPTQKLIDSGPIQTLYMDRSLVDGVIELPAGAHPTSNVPDYGIDMDHLQAYVAAKGEEGWARYTREFVELEDHSRYIEAVGGAARIAALPPPVF